MSTRTGSPTTFGSVEITPNGGKENDGRIVLTVLVVLVVLWLIGFVAGIGGGLIHLLLVVARIILVYNLIAGRRTV